ncbi:plasmid partitioning protein RepB C-terminal domain-containing protein [Parasphingorhabdus sp.]|uniref:plasmid partitioning protein RepB C-terminal domain-containing protein n=1 Tax=Parasphingorhabdus sp. TaxID=2709688 RepID=UPI002F941BD7
MSRGPEREIRLAFERVSQRIAFSDIDPLRSVPLAIKKSRKYGQIVSSIEEVGIIEPPVVARKKGNPERYLLLDGHLRIEALKERGETEVVCLVATEDEAITYNKNLSRIAPIQEHRMILNAVKKGASEERLAKALNVNIASIRNRRQLLNGICDEVATLLQDYMIPFNTFKELKRLRPLRQIAAAENMIAMNRFSKPYAQTLVASSSQSELISSEQKKVSNLSAKQMEHMEREAANIDREFKLIEQGYGADHLDLVLATGYLCRLVENVRVVRYLASHHPELLAEFQKIIELREAN